MVLDIVSMKIEQHDTVSMNAFLSRDGRLINWKFLRRTYGPTPRSGLLHPDN
jgi:hypothetical protein